MIKKIYTLVLLIIFVPQLAFGADFEAGYVISDEQLLNHNSMDLDDIQDFLNKKSGTLADYFTVDIDNKTKSAAEIIYTAAQRYQINPQYILVTLQKEQSLIDDATPQQKQYDWAMGYGVCDSCSKDDPKIQKFKGFAKQIDEAVGANVWYIENANNGWIKKSGKFYTIDEQLVFIQNQATANLYNYTPHIHGNYNFWKIWNSWFLQNYPDGSLIQAEGKPEIYVLQNGQKRYIQSMSALVSRYDPKKIITVSQSEVDKYESGINIKFPNYSILKSPTDTIYLLVNDKLRKFENNEVVRSLGFNPEEFDDISFDDILNFEMGEPITMESAYPAGALLQDNTTGGVFFVQEGKKYPILSKDIMKINYPRYKITQVTPDELDKFELGETVKLKDGEIVRAYNSNAVYVISNGKKRPIPSGEVFESLGFKWNNINFVEAKTLSNIPLGDFIDLDYKN